MEHDFHRDLKRQAADFLSSEGWTVYQEPQLQNDKRPDLVGIHSSGKIIIVEVKTSLSSSDFHAAWNKYSPFCDDLYIAAPATANAFTSGELPLLDFIQTGSRIGILLLKQPRARVLRYANGAKISEELRARVLEIVTKSGRTA
jgi:hypothetical protein